MTFLLLQLLTGLANAMVLFLIASGLTLIFGVTRIVNFAHGAFFMLAAYLAATLAGLPALGAAAFPLALLGAPLVLAALGALLEVGLLRRIYGAPELHQLLLTFALVLLLGDGVRLVWGPENRTAPLPAALAWGVPLLGQLFPLYELLMLAAGPAVALALWWLLARTRWGILIRAATHDREMVGALGVDQRRLFTGVFALGAALAGLAGALQAPRQALSLGMDSAVIAESFVVVVVGGMGSVGGAFLGAVLIGCLQALGILWLPRELQLPLVFLLMAVVLVLRPWGLLGRPEEPAAAPAGMASGLPELPRAAAPLALLVLALAPLVLPTFGLWVATEILALALFAASLQLLLGAGGMVSFGHAAYFGLGAYGAALCMTAGPRSFPLALLAAPVLAAAAALLFGTFCVRRAGIYFAMLTLAVAQLTYALAHQWYEVTGGDNGIVGVWPPGGLASPVAYYYLALAAGAGGLWLLGRVGASPFGLLLRAARDHAPRAEAAGVDVRGQQLVAFVVAGAFAGLGGGLYVFLKGSVFPDLLGIPVSVEGLIMVLLGGLESLPGAALGAALFEGLDVLAGRVTEYWQAVLGTLLLALVLLFPRGLAPALLGRRCRDG
ncbi:MAG: ABC transporter permease [Candidatus Methylomirabilales bacterium]